MGKVKHAQTPPKFSWRQAHPDHEQLLQVPAVSWDIAEDGFLLQLERLHGFGQSCPLPGNHRKGLEAEITSHGVSFPCLSAPLRCVVPASANASLSLTAASFLDPCLLYKGQKSWPNAWLKQTQLLYRCARTESLLVLSLLKTNQLLFCSLWSTVTACPPQGKNKSPPHPSWKPICQRCVWGFAHGIIFHGLRALCG